MPTIVWTVANLVLLALAIAAVLVLAARVLGLQLRLEQCETQLANIERTERMTPAKLAELSEVNEGVQRAQDLLKKLNQREVMRARRDDGTYAPMNGSDKDALRRRAGLRAGMPAPHK